MSRRVSSNAVLAAMAAAAVIGALAVYALLSGWGSEPEPTKQGAVTGSLSASPSPHSAVAMTKGAAKELEDGLVSNYRPVLNTVLADGYKPPLAESGTVIKIDRGSLHQHKSAGQVRASVTKPGGKPVTVTLYLEKSGSNWRVRAMEEVK